MFNVIYDQSRRCEYSKCKKKKETDLINFLLIFMLQIESVHCIRYAKIRVFTDSYSRIRTES